jgi:hypothetical protein
VVKQVQLRRLDAEAGQDRMGLAAMVGLVIEPVRERRNEAGDHRLGRRHAAIADGPLERLIAERIDDGNDALILRLPSRAQRREILEQDRIEPVLRLALAGDALKPDAVGDQQMIERAMHRAEEGAAVGAIVRVIERGRGLVEAPVSPLIVTREDGEVVVHHGLGLRSRLCRSARRVECRKPDRCLQIDSSTIKDIY